MVKLCLARNDLSELLEDCKKMQKNGPETSHGISLAVGFTHRSDWKDRS